MWNPLLFKALTKQKAVNALDSISAFILNKFISLYSVGASF